MSVPRGTAAIIDLARRRSPEPYGVEDRPSEGSTVEPEDPAAEIEALLQAGFRYALSLCPERADAEDLVQEAWYRLVRRRGSVANRPLLLATIRHLYIDRYRRQRLVQFTPLEDVDEPVDPSRTLEALAAAKDLAKPLAKLRTQEREALFLHAVEGYSAAEIATLTRRSRNTVLSLIHRAKLKLAHFLGGEEIP